MEQIKYLKQQIKVAGEELDHWSRLFSDAVWSENIPVDSEYYQDLEIEYEDAKDRYRYLKNLEKQLECPKENK